MRCEHGSPSRAQSPQLGLQHTNPVLHVAMPQLTLCGYSIALSQILVASQAWPGRVQMPQLELQHTSPTLHVLGPHETLSGIVDMPHTS